MKGVLQLLTFDSTVAPIGTEYAKVTKICPDLNLLSGSRVMPLLLTPVSP